jgi:DnaJ-class molecular chaperone
MPTGGGSAGGGMPAGFHFSSSGGGGIRPEDIFAQFFGTNSPFEAESKQGGSGGMGGFQSMGSMGGMFPGMMGGMGSGVGSGRPRKQATIENKLFCTLDELFNGCTKKMKITKTVVDERGSRTQAQKVLEIPVRRGWKKGTKVTFEREGDQYPGVEAADIAFIVEEKPHERFTRRGNDLHLNCDLTLQDALCGTTLTVAGIDGRQIRFSVGQEEVVQPGASQRIRGEGMPLSKTNGANRGDLVVHFNVRFPTRLKAEQKSIISQALRPQR